MCGGARGRCPPPRPPAVPRAPRVTRGCSLIQVAAEVEAGPRPCALALPTGRRTWIHMRPRRGTREPQSPNHPRDRHRSVGQPFVAPGAPWPRVPYRRNAHVASAARRSLCLSNSISVCAVSSMLWPSMMMLVHCQCVQFNLHVPTTSPLPVVRTPTEVRPCSAMLSPVHPS